MKYLFEMIAPMMRVWQRDKLNETEDVPITSLRIYIYMYMQALNKIKNHVFNNRNKITYDCQGDIVYWITNGGLSQKRIDCLHCWSSVPAYV